MKLWYCRKYRIECSLSTGTKAMITRICSLMWFCQRLGKMNSSQNGTSGRVISRGFTGGVPSS